MSNETRVAQLQALGLSESAALKEARKEREQYATETGYIPTVVWYWRGAQNTTLVERNPFSVKERLSYSGWLLGAYKNIFMGRHGV